ncbi:unnamed protein product [Coregonus sp. 'balchen']|nr:unnamed protein product [Coregonus sp. 'balchen']
MAKPPPPGPHSRNIYLGMPEESEPQRRWRYGHLSPSVTLGPGDGGRRDADHLMEQWEKLALTTLHTDDLLNQLSKVKAQRVQNALQLYNLFLTKHGEDLKNHIVDLISIADNLDMVGVL